MREWHGTQHMARNLVVERPATFSTAIVHVILVTLVVAIQFVIVSFSFPPPLCLAASNGF
jgi:hypothetical protein